jgi:hypothetical protein
MPIIILFVLLLGFIIDALLGVLPAAVALTAVAAYIILGTTFACWLLR